MRMAFVKRQKPSFPCPYPAVHARAGDAPASPERAGTAGLVTLQTSPLENNQNNTAHREKSYFEVSFDKAVRAQKRVKRLKRNVYVAGRLHSLADHGKRPPVAHFVTLTYVGVDDWRADHISDATEQFRRYCARLRIECRYVWVAELQKRGAVHYHLLAWLPKGVAMPHWDKPHVTPSGRTVAPFWSHGMTNCQVARSGVGYLMKYLSKLGSDAIFPPHLRLYGCGGLVSQARITRCWYNLPEWAKREHGVGDLKRQASRLIVIETGEILPAMYSVVKCPEERSIKLFPLREMPEKWHDGAYSTWPPRA